MKPLLLIFYVAFLVLCPLLVFSQGFLNGIDDKLLKHIFDASKDIDSWVVALRRDLHTIPEPGFKEHQTAAYIRNVLDFLEVNYTSGLAHGTGILAEVSIPGTSGDAGEVVVVLRADMDALPVLEPSGILFRSNNEGWMHACGHDGHVAMLLGAAALLKHYEQLHLLSPSSSSLSSVLSSPTPRPRMVVRLAFQPAEEGGAGGDVLVQQGAMANAAAAFGIHLMPHLPSGIVGVRDGTIMAGAISFHITVKGRGGHAAMPHTNRDPIVATAHLITALQTLVSRETSPLGSAVLSVTFIHGGDAYNVIPAQVVIGGTIRALSRPQLSHLQRRLTEQTQLVARALGCEAQVDWREDEQPYYPPTVNDPHMARLVAEIASSEAVTALAAEYPTEPLMAGEDFAFFCEAGPCALAFLGIRDEERGVGIAPLHSPLYIMDETMLRQGAALHTAVALAVLHARVPGGLDLTVLDSGASLGVAEKLASFRSSFHRDSLGSCVRTE
mmetsp:Transcript_1918/g.2843  ORF Transcript_1918/g.2843 Transcript_1918/m.2843 type:complete len:498 (-) Transcript_1918:198-1691(-)|eukprot:CAMPEP_0175050044 /NCGR_PEP_ID=MMETSP0052_2-20121109/7055_1 /TAXON_ID=51329 ORGANISM="Polytomella parva, Strain SAG 63-3" /NCGR_SAMPLE_ID=MMETSP0052_2 /ASSEMBLY_ACC=CAM_ASM_000194 /LENGTH=497 /DNA_ID=CAMNT_0016314233 /DNA_START=92 /DNA_END=1585 /DNA_ORIENTATION=+